MARSTTCTATTLRLRSGQALGSASLTTNASGGGVSQNRYYPFGASRLAQGTRPTDVDFTGQRLDGTGLHFYNARYYASGLGRFISADTIVPEPGGSQGFNRYVYTYNSPVKHTDPTGHFAEDELDEFYSGWREQWSEVLKTLMLHSSTTWGSILYLGYGGDEPSLIVLVTLEQSEYGKNSFWGTFVGLGGSDKSEYYWEYPSSKYTHGTAFNAGDDGSYSVPSDFFDSKYRQHSETNWIAGRTLTDFIGPNGYLLGPGVGLARYRDWDEYGMFTTGPVDMIVLLGQGLRDWVIGRDKDPEILFGPLVANYLQTDYPVILLAPNYGYGDGTIGVVPPLYNSPFSPQPYR